jgi:hypothetical protein
MARKGLTGYYHIEAWRDATCVWFSTTTQRRAVRGRVERAIADFRADTTFVNYIESDQRTSVAVAQVTGGGFWKWQNDSKGLREFIEEGRYCNASFMAGASCELPKRHEGDHWTGHP